MIVSRSATDHVDHSHSPSRIVGLDEVLSDIAYYGACDEYDVTFDYEPDETDDNFKAFVTVTIRSLETTVTYEWTEKG